MSFNKGYELKKFEAHWEKLRIEYAVAGMTEEAIQKMYDYDRQQFNSERTFVERTQEFTAPAYEGSEEEASPLMLRYQEVITTTDTYHETKSKFAWIGEIENERLLSALENLSEDDLNLFFYVPWKFRTFFVDRRKVFISEFRSANQFCDGCSGFQKSASFFFKELLHFRISSDRRMFCSLNFSCDRCFFFKKFLISLLVDQTDLITFLAET